jgi:hemerythrin-like domain-containing protein
MHSTPDAPADTTMMRIVHDALRRDLARASEVLRAPATASRAQLRALGAHLGWMMRFLHAHHRSEDDGLYPLVRERAGAATDIEVLDRMHRGHAAVAAASHAVEAAATALAADPSDDAVQRAASALGTLSEVLLPHLR